MLGAARHRLQPVLCAVMLLAASCVDADPPAMRVLVTVIATQEGQPAEEATASLVAQGRRALVVIEAALHTANPAGRRRLIRAIRRLGDEDGIALLGHVARYDLDASVRDEARATLLLWSEDRTQPARAEAAARALADVATRALDRSSRSGF